MAESIEFGIASEDEIESRFITSYDSNYIYINFTENEVKAYLTVAVVGGLALSIAGTLAAGGVITIAGLTIAQATIASAVGQAILGFSTLLTLWWSPKTVLLKIPIPIFKPKSGNVEYVGKNSLGFNDSKKLYIAF